MKRSPVLETYSEIATRNELGIPTAPGAFWCFLQRGSRIAQPHTSKSAIYIYVYSSRVERRRGSARAVAAELTNETAQKGGPASGPGEGPQCSKFGRRRHHGPTVYTRVPDKIGRGRAAAVRAQISTIDSHVMRCRYICERIRYWSVCGRGEKCPKILDYTVRKIITIR